MMMCPSSTESTKNSSNNTPTAVGVKKAQKTKAKTPSKTTAKKRFSPKKYPKPTLEELALLVGSKPQKTQSIEPIEKPLPYELKWRENGAELCLYAANQTFIATQISRLQTHVVKPMKLPALAQSVEIQPEALICEAEITVEVPSSLNEYIPVEKPSVEQSVLEESYPKPTAFNELSALLGLSEVEAFENETPHPVEEEEDNCPTSVELEFETPIEAQLAGYLGVKYASKTTISVTDEPANATNTQAVSQHKALLPLLPVEDYFSEALEAELAQQKAWLESALEREKNKAYPSNIPHPINKPATLIETVKEEAFELQDSDAADDDTLLIQAEAEMGAEKIVAETEENTPSENEQNFAAVLDSLMEDFSGKEGEEPSATEEAVEEILLDEQEEETEAVIQSDAEVEPEIEAEATEAIDSFEVVGIYATETSTPAEAESLSEDVTLPAVTQEPPASNQPEEITTFNQLLKITKPNTPMDFLLLGAYFLRQQEQKETFSLRQLNHLLSSVSKPNANHTVLELALAKHFITMMPDLTGTATATEYQLSKTGEAAALRLFQTVPM
jgi:hypothetical protein